MAEHRDLTGDALHEPKGIETAPAGTVYVSDGGGSGEWTNVLSGVRNLNSYTLDQRMDDLAAPSSIYFVSPHKSQIKRLNVVLYAPIDANTVISIAINGVAFADTLTINSSGSAAGQVKTLVPTTPHTIPANGVLTITSNGAATASVMGFVQLELEAIP